MNRLFALAATTAAVGFAEADLRAQSAADSASVTAFYGRWFRDQIRRPVASDRDRLGSRVPDVERQPVDVRLSIVLPK